ncbi:MAG: ABC transporter ATP-binding protein [Omnitrophica WOR_2 bacterium GWF2_38_59]|nr:MAG: ABC transporter ATP-binding protein [Omnitrophica WOR_2 bacterium GWF2_38_59]OGX49771.1 MAG: ABC transporter ATP-binding protein [Omnitrophica WOR_2 bacterium RIFOXYA2_FULL_38_17]OGX55641.1 MAG: ABC transporter ATP-binding protein [Omnitrophica WOR_2 bacterium RIFOXYC2_FULL_38_12]OGX60085.1 MAG: ABC transporter ATP-binding protein [Omnitrophica WOR_2 bacterium RIFOXYB2_FULL_38_16]HBG61401.1 ABC transporter ATP-binding protein [Candidatus Omnitrophota bacterium]
MIEIVNLNKSFGENVVLKNVNLTIETGQTKVIIGRSGVGKSVLLKSIMGILIPDSGSIKIDGVEVTDLPEKEYNKIRMKIGMVFQGGALFDSMNVAENVAFVLNEFMRLDKRTVDKKIEESLALVGLQGVEDMMPSELSGGMKKRVSLARVLCMDPEVIFYDEPTTGVDPVTADAINTLIVELRNKLDVTSIVVTHDMNSAYKVADKIAMIYSGQVIAEGTPQEIQQATHPVVRQFINGDAKGPITDGEHLVFGHLT